MNPLLRQAAFVSIDDNDKRICIDLGIVAAITSSPNTLISTGETVNSNVRVYLLKTGECLYISLTTPKSWWDKVGNMYCSRTSTALYNLLTLVFPKRIVVTLGGDYSFWAYCPVDWGIL